MEQTRRIRQNFLVTGMLTGLLLSLWVETASADPGGAEEPTPPMAQVTSVSELTDVQSTDWAFQALQSLVERYGLVAGYPDGTFRGQQAMTRSEFAAALAQFLEQFNQFLSTERARQIVRAEDLATLKRLQSEYRLALDDLQQRLERLTTTTTELEANQFSPTTKLQGQTILAFTAGSAANSTMVARVRLNLLTSFAPNDLLVTQLETGNGGLDAVALAQSQGPNLLGTTGILADGGGLEYVGFGSDVRLSKAYYTFQPQPDLVFTLGAVLNPRDFIDRTVANDSAVDFNSSFFANNPLIVQNQIDRPGGAGVAARWNLGASPLTLRALYIATDASNPRTGLFGGNQYQGSAELEYRFEQAIALRLQYTTAVVNQTAVQAGGVNVEWAFNRKTALFGRYGFGSYQGFNSGLSRNLNLHPQTWAIGVTLRDLGIPGTLAGLAIGQPFVEGSLGDAPQTNYELFYNLSLSDNISITPAFLVVDSANNNRSNPTIWQGTLRTVFSF